MKENGAMVIKIEPGEFSWLNDWLPRSRAWAEAIHNACKTSPVEAVSAATRLQKENDAWLLSLTPKLHRDIADLIRAEVGLLYETIDPSASGATKPKADSDEAADFRERFYHLLPLAIAMDRLRLPAPGDIHTLPAVLQLEGFAATRRWLP
jgi:hypothetical protein